MGKFIGTAILVILRTVVGKIIEYFIMKKKITDDAKRQALEDVLESQKKAGATEEAIKAAQDEVAQKAKEVEEIDDILAALQRFRNKE